MLHEPSFTHSFSPGEPKEAADQVQSLIEILLLLCKIELPKRARPNPKATSGSAERPVPADCPPTITPKYSTLCMPTYALVQFAVLVAPSNRPSIANGAISPSPSIFPSRMNVRFSPCGALGRRARKGSSLSTGLKAECHLPFCVDTRERARRAIHAVGPITLVGPERVDFHPEFLPSVSEMKPRTLYACHLISRMRRFASFAKLAFALLGLAATLVAAGPFAGTWKLNLEKSKYKTGSPPKEQTATIAEAGSDLAVTISGTAADGTATMSHYTVPAQGGEGKIIQSALRACTERNGNSILDLPVTSVKDFAAADGFSWTKPQP
jgi:hypothetical protein